MSEKKQQKQNRNKTAEQTSLQNLIGGSEHIRTESQRPSALTVEMMTNF